MEDSGIDSEDIKQNTNYINQMEIETKEQLLESDDSSNNNLEVIFRNKNYVKSSTPKNDYDANYHHGRKNTNNSKNIINNNNNVNHNNINNNNKSNHINTCKTLQRKLELKVERAKRNYNQLHPELNETKAKTSNLIPINRLQIPGYHENVPLVEYKSENSDDDDEVSFFPIKSKSLKKQDLSDTFSIQEMSIEGMDSDDSESQNLELLLPPNSNKFTDILMDCFCCKNIRTN